MMKVDFINIGPGRSGTTWLYQLFENHPEISLPVVKETEFFNNNMRRGLDWYENLFPNRNDSTAIFGEISNMYYCDKQALLNIKAYNPNIKIIFNYRKPHDLLVSFLKFGLRRGLDIPEGEFIKTYPIGMLMGSGYADRLSNGSLSEGDMVSVYESVMLSRFISIVYDIFGHDNVFIFNYDELSEDPYMISKNVFDFLGVSDYKPELLNPNPVNSAAEPRLHWLGKFASAVAFYLRKYQFFSLLSFMHSSRIVKRLVLKPMASGPVMVSAAMKDDLMLENDRINAIINSDVGL